MEKKSMMLGGGLLALSGGLSLLNRINKSSKSITKALERMKKMPGWGDVEKTQSQGKDFIKFLKGGNAEDHKEIIRSYINMADDVFGDAVGNTVAQGWMYPKTFRWLRDQGLWKLPKELKGPVPLNAKSYPSQTFGTAPGEAIHYRELGGSGKTRALRHWLIESQTKGMRNFSGFTDTQKKLIQQLDDEVLKLQQKGLDDNKVFETVLGQDFMKPHLSQIVVSKAGTINPWNPSSHVSAQIGYKDFIDKMPYHPDAWANSSVVSAALGGSAISTGVGATHMYREATKPWHEKWQDKLNDWIS